MLKCQLKKVENAIKEAYALIDLSEPDIIFCDSLLEAEEMIDTRGPTESPLSLLPRRH
ncbi:MAG: hypothetical protein KME32_02785 [Mojavia pulchra JT2-VF2]|uniref:Uncharacterized protein n=1 Tax=Mojavia pulchra JT2-VF2 TaxID=287848 RepID=A0A951PUF2_9NOST|nr:hypothetical protein [Mojavia pulchra JT2-VF2]